jgi:hypothetical protein
MTPEEFRPIPGYPMYQVSNAGNVRSARRTWKTSQTWKSMHPRIGSDGCLRIVMRDQKTGKRKSFKVAFWVLAIFGSPRPRGTVCCSKNGNPRDCRIENLEWGTWRESKAIRERLGHTAKGTKNGRAKLTEDDVRWIRSYGDNRRNWRDGKLQGSTAVALRFAVDAKIIRDIVKRKTWKHIRGSVHASASDLRVT